MTTYMDYYPYQYVDWLTGDCLTGDFPGSVNIDTYLCAVSEYGGNNAAMELRRAVLDVAKAKGRKIVDEVGKTDFERIWTGQGKPEHQVQVMNFIWAFKDDFGNWPGPKKNYPIEKYFAWRAENPFKEMVKKKCFGLDCIGFVGRLMEDSGVFKSYPPYYPRNYADKFFPVTSVSAVAPGCVLIWVNGTHIAVIDWVYPESVGAGKVKIDLCQSSAGGPQTNVGVILQQISSANYIDFGGYGKAAANASEEEKKQLRKEYTKENQTTGYRGGIFFKIFHAGVPAAPVTGNVYVGRMPDMQIREA